VTPSTGASQAQALALDQRLGPELAGRSSTRGSSTGPGAAPRRPEWTTVDDGRADGQVLTPAADHDTEVFRAVMRWYLLDPVGVYANRVVVERAWTVMAPTRDCQKSSRPGRDDLLRSPACLRVRPDRPIWDSSSCSITSRCVCLTAASPSGSTQPCSRRSPPNYSGDDLAEWNGLLALQATRACPPTSGPRGLGARSPAQVDAFWQSGTGPASPTTADRDPAAPRDDYYGGFLRDPDGTVSRPSTTAACGPAGSTTRGCEWLPRASRRF
jgi:hypothetical protein